MHSERPPLTNLGLICYRRQQYSTHIVDTMSRSKSPPDLRIPASESTVQVRVIDTKTRLHLNPKLFWHPEIPNFDGIIAPIYCFLISHGNSHVIFDLGVRPDWENYPPRVVSLIQATTTVTTAPGADVASVLDNDASGLGIRTHDIEAAIWSHNHFDHIGDISRFPKSTSLIVGPGVRDASWPGYPTNPDAIVFDKDIEGRVVREISFDGPKSLKIGRFNAFDYFGDGSFYLLDAPGHAVGHMCGLARTEASSFVFMGADACHNLGVLRPSKYLPLPDSLSLANSLGGKYLSGYGLCPGDHLHDYLARQEGNNVSGISPFFTVAKGPIFPDYDAAMETVAKIQELDVADSVLVLMAHDLSLVDKIPLFPDTINGWKQVARGRLKEDTRWLFCRDFLPALEVNAGGTGSKGD